MKLPEFARHGSKAVNLLLFDALSHRELIAIKRGALSLGVLPRRRLRVVLSLREELPGSALAPNKGTIMVFSSHLDCR